MNTRCGTVQALTFAGLVFFVALTVLAFWLLYAQAMTLEITGHSVGQGVQNLSFAGDLLNVSLAQNGTSWNISLVGASP